MRIHNRRRNETKTKTEKTQGGTNPGEAERMLWENYMDTTVIIFVRKRGRREKMEYLGVIRYMERTNRRGMKKIKQGKEQSRSRLSALK